MLIIHTYIRKCECTYIAESDQTKSHMRSKNTFQAFVCMAMSYVWLCRIYGYVVCMAMSFYVRMYDYVCLHSKNKTSHSLQTHVSGAFEVELIWVIGSVEYSVTLYSKLCTSKFPSARKLCGRLEAAFGMTDF
jgi:hypothetical protein